MSSSQAFESKLHTLADDAAASAGQAINSTKRAADSVLNTLSDKVDDLRDDSSGAAKRIAEQIDDLAHRAVALAKQAGSGVRKQAERTGELTVGYVKDEPVKAILMAAAAGAATAVLLGMLSRGRQRD